MSRQFKIPVGAIEELEQAMQQRNQEEIQMKREELREICTAMTKAGDSRAAATLELFKDLDELKGRVAAAAKVAREALCPPLTEVVSTIPSIAELRLPVTDEVRQRIDDADDAAQEALKQSVNEFNEAQSKPIHELSGIDPGVFDVNTDKAAGSHESKGTGV